MSERKPVIKLTYDKNGDFPVKLDECGYVKWPITPTDDYDYQIHFHELKEPQ